MSDRKKISQELRVFVLSLYDNECVYCGEKKFLHIHHVNEDPADNKIENLLVLCGLCHQTEHPDNEGISEFNPEINNR